MLLGCPEPLAQVYDCGLYDLDGVCYRGTNPVEYAAESITQAARQGLAPIYVTNNASRPVQVVAQHLTELGIPASNDNVYTAARAAAELAQEVLEPGSAVLVIGGAGLREELVGHGFQLVESADDHPHAVVQGFDKSITWHDLSEGALAISAGATHIASNLDATLPAERGHMLANGSLVKAVENATGVRPLATGKPLAKVYHQAAAHMNSVNPLAIGDRLNTDIAGSVNAGYHGLHVLTGIATPADVAMAVPGERPTYVATDLRALLEPMPEPEQINDRWVVGTEWASWTGESFDTSRPLRDANEDLYRAILCSAWTALDTGTDREKIALCVKDLAVSRP